MDWQRRFLGLGKILENFEPLWRPAPFHVPRPAWCDHYPEVVAALQRFSPEQVSAIEADNGRLIAYLARFFPEVGELGELVSLPKFTALPFGGKSWRVPGRKEAQIDAFCAGVGAPAAPLLEWCSGKGHLGRRLAEIHDHPVTSLDHDPALCAAGEALALRAKVAQKFFVADALRPETESFLRGRHVVALHACGELHLKLVENAGETAALDFAPCCHYRISAPRYSSFSASTLELDKNALHLAVTDTVTAGARERRQKDADMVKKLGFIELRADISGVRRQFKPIPGAWAALGFEAWCRRLAEREGLILPEGIDYSRYATLGEKRREEVARLALVRLAFRRALEVWLAVDKVIHLEKCGFETRVSEFCPRELTPRNLLVSARR